MAGVAMKRLSGIVLVLVVASVALLPFTVAAASGGLLGQLQCPCDCGKYLSVCDCSTADTARSYVQQMEDQGLTNPEIADAYGSEFGEDYVEYVPKKGSGLSLWVTPLAGVVVGAGGIYVYFRRFRGNHDTGSLSICPDCGNELDDHTDYCPSCGANVEESW